MANLAISFRSIVYDQQVCVTAWLCIPRDCEPNKTICLAGPGRPWPKAAGVDMGHWLGSFLSHRILRRPRPQPGGRPGLWRAARTLRGRLWSTSKQPLTMTLRVIRWGGQDCEVLQGSDESTSLARLPLFSTDAGLIQDTRQEGNTCLLYTSRCV